MKKKDIYIRLREDTFGEYIQIATSQKMKRAWETDLSMPILEALEKKGLKKDATYKLSFSKVNRSGSTKKK